jgi:hypothetical protein
MTGSEQSDRLVALLDAQVGRYRSLNNATSFRAYLETPRTREDEELLTEPILAEILEQLLGFPKDAYFPQLGRSGLKPDFTPIDLVAHRFVLDAKSSTQDLEPHEAQIRKYIDQRQLDLGVLFNLREVRVYRRGVAGHDPLLSFQLLPLWQAAQGEAMAPVEQARLKGFCELFSFRSMSLSDKVALVADAEPWQLKLGRGERVDIDLEFLVSRLRLLSRVLAEDAAAQHQLLLDDLDFNPEHERRLRLELEVLAREIEPKADPADLPASATEYPAAGGLAGRAWRQYLMRVSQLTLIRILLYRSWEDAGFVDDRLYDGGFGMAYERLEKSLQRVLDEAYLKGRERYPWLFGADNNYDWYRPRDEALAEVLYALVPVPLGRLGADVLGGLYESYVDDIDRDRLGQFYTPRSVVSFMLDRVGFRGADGVFKISGDERKPRSIFDFSTGSGGFLVEAARRVVDDAGLRHDDPADLRDGLKAIVRGFHGCEISPFPYFLTEVNLLLQVSRVLGRMRAIGQPVPNFTLGVVHTDALGARVGAQEAKEEAPLPTQSAALRGADERYGISTLDREKQSRFDEVRKDATFDFVVGNPPYVAEAGNKVLFDRLRALPGWDGDYRGKSDYLYYFLLMAAEKLAPGGRLAVITPAGWMNAGNADWLRERLAGMLRLDELFLFGSMRVFATEQEERDTRAGAQPPTVESAILVATRAKVDAKHKLRVVVLEDEGAVAEAIPGAAGTHAPGRRALLAEMGRRADRSVGREKGLLVHDVPQMALRSTRPWPVKHTSRDVASRVVAHLQRRLDAARSPVEPLERRWHVFQGIQSGADAYTARIQKRLSDPIKAQLAAAGRTTGEPILELPPAVSGAPPWSAHPHLLARSPEPRALLYGAIDEDDRTDIVWIARDDEVPAEVVEALEPWRDVLRTRAEFVRNTKRRWYETAWPRDRAQMLAPKVIALYRTDRGRFALDEDGSWQPSIKTTITTAREEGLSVAYLCGVLNSELLDLWYAIRGKTPWHDRRNYEPKPMNAMPYRHVTVPAGWEPSGRFAALASALETPDADLSAPVAALIGAVGTADADADALRATEELVRALAANRRELLPLRETAPELRRIIKNPWRTHGAVVDPAAVARLLPKEQTVSVRLDPALKLEVQSDGVLGRPTLDDHHLTFRHARKVTASVEGPAARLAVVARALHPTAMASELGAVLLPKDLAILEAAVTDAERIVNERLARGRALVECVERLVCALYGLDAKLTELVVASAVTRAGASAEPADDD